MSLHSMQTILTCTYLFSPNKRSGPIYPGSHGGRIDQSDRIIVLILKLNKKFDSRLFIKFFKIVYQWLLHCSSNYYREKEKLLDFLKISFFPKCFQYRLILCITWCLNEGMYSSFCDKCLFPSSNHTLLSI